jgi:hypothetical protein
MPGSYVVTLGDEVAEGVAGSVLLDFPFVQLVLSRSWQW